MTVTEVKPVQVTVRQPVRTVVTHGQQGPAGAQGAIGPSGASLTPALWNNAGTFNVSANTINVVVADGVTLNLAFTPDNCAPLEFVVPQAYAGFTLNGGSKFIDGRFGDVTFPTPCSLRLVYLPSEQNWFIFSMYTGQNPA